MSRSGRNIKKAELLCIKARSEIKEQTKPCWTQKTSVAITRHCWRSSGPRVERISYTGITESHRSIFLKCKINAQDTFIINMDQVPKNKEKQIIYFKRLHVQSGQHDRIWGADGLLWVLAVEVVIRLYTCVKICKSVHPKQTDFTVVNCKINKSRHFRIQQS